MRLPRLGEDGAPGASGCFDTFFLVAGASEAFFSAGGVFKGFGFFYRAGEDVDRHHLGDFFAGLEFDGCVAEVGHQDKDFATVAGINDAAGCGDSACGHGGAVADQQAEGRAGGWVASFYSDAGADFCRGAGGEGGCFEGEDVIAEVFAGMCDYREAGADASKRFTRSMDLIVADESEN